MKVKRAKARKVFTDILGSKQGEEVKNLNGEKVKL